MMMKILIKRRNLIIYGSLAAVLIAALVTLGVVVPRWLSTSPAQTAPQAASADARKIRARLFYVAEDGVHLTAVDQEVPYGEGTVEQAKRIVEAQVATARAPLASAIPTGTTLRTLFLTPGGQAYVDLSPEVSTAHPGGTTDELLTVYTLVNALTVNLPAITGVQILVEGKEIDSLAGHLDLRRPLGQDLRWIAQ